MTGAMQWAHTAAGQVIDPHTAIGLAAARGSGVSPDIPVVTLATAHPAKFPDAVERAIALLPALPGRLGPLFEMEERYATRPATLDSIKDYVCAHGTRRRSAS